MIQKKKKYLTKTKANRNYVLHRNNQIKFFFRASSRVIGIRRKIDQMNNIQN